MRHSTIGRRTLALVAVALGASACERLALSWRPSPAFARTDTAYVSDGVRISVERVAPHGRGRHPAVLVLLPSDGTRGDGGRYVRRYAEEFARHGYVAFIVHYFDRTGTVQSDDDEEDREFPVWTDALRDGVRFAQEDSLVAPRRIGAFGFSLGGYMALALGARDPRVHALVVVSGGLFDALAPEVRRMPPTLLLHGGDDDVVPPAEARRVDSTLSSLGVPHQLVIYPGQGHGLTDAADSDAVSRAVRFFDGHLRGRRPPDR